MISIHVPGSGPLVLEHLVLDFSGTLAFEGRLLPGVREKITELAERLAVHVLTSDTFGTAQAELHGLPLEVLVLSSGDHAVQKERFVQDVGSVHTAAIGNGMNDARMLKTSALGIVVLGGEGASAAALVSADVVTRDINDALALLLNPLRLKATLRR